VKVLSTPAKIVVLAFVLRVALFLALGTYRVPPANDHWRFGFEMGREARSLALGRGFGSPYQGDTGPTAHFPPLYPLLIAGVFKLFGVYTDASALVVYSLNSLFSALTCWVLFRIGEQAFGRHAGVVAAWIWAFHPLAYYFTCKWIWETNLSALLLSLGVLATLRAAAVPRPRAWVGLGVVWGLIALTNSSLLAVLPFALLWLCWQSRGQGPRLARPLAAFGLALGLCVAPWAWRNYRVFGAFIPLRSNFWMEVHLGNNEEAQGLPVLAKHPSHNPHELALYRQMGELAYFQQDKKQALAFISAHPARFARLSLLRIRGWWIAGWEIGMTNRLGALLVGLEFIAIGAQNALAWIGTVLLLRRRHPAVFLFASVMFVYPAIFYVLFAARRYRHPMEPILVMLAVVAVVETRKKLPPEQITISRLAGSEVPSPTTSD
jgi:4-amino-4-deoxy-L-arabinose transferase-like glycosyltransferase